MSPNSESQALTDELVCGLKQMWSDNFQFVLESALVTIGVKRHNRLVTSADLEFVVDSGIVGTKGFLFW